MSCSFPINSLNDKGSVDINKVLLNSQKTKLAAYSHETKTSHNQHPVFHDAHDSLLFPFTSHA